jgi:hypothetical protein
MSPPSLWPAGISPDHTLSSKRYRQASEGWWDLILTTPENVGKHNPYPAIRLKEPTLSDILGVEI